LFFGGAGIGISMRLENPWLAIGHTRSFSSARRRKTKRNNVWVAFFYKQVTTTWFGADEISELFAGNVGSNAISFFLFPHA